MRNEIKYLIKKSESSQILKKLNALKTFPARFIYSIYFDTKEFKNFIDSEEGTVPRSKWRIRTYSNNRLIYNKVDSLFNKNFYIEKKETFSNHRSKKKILLKNISIEKTTNMINIMSKSKMEPKVMITYFRNYYILQNGNRITLDSKINYFKIKSDLIYLFKNNIGLNVLEEKKSLDFEDNSVFSILGDKHSRLSKYCEAVRSEGAYTTSGMNELLHLKPIFNDADIYGHGKPTRIANSTKDVRQKLGSLPIAERMASRVFSVPWFKHYRPDVIKEYADAFAKVSKFASQIEQ